MEKTEKEEKEGGRNRAGYLVAGAGVSGLGAVKLLCSCGEDCILYDSNENLSEEEIRKKLPDGATVPVLLGELSPEDVRDVKACVISPGIPLTAPFVGVLRAEKIPVWSEVELAYRYGKGRVCAITGTNGKTTTTALAGEILGRYFSDVHVVGNIGSAYTLAAPLLKETSVTVAELSSFQLESIVTFHPLVSAILNVTPDHLDRHGTMDNYERIKEDITKNQTSGDWCVLNYEDERLRAFGEKTCVPQVVFFSSRRRIPGGIYLEDGSLFSEMDGEKELLCRTEELNILGRHNYENAMAAAAVCRLMGVPLSVIREGCLAFTAVEHRIEFVREVGGVAYYNDSKGTNPDAAIQAVGAMTRPTVLIGGGYDKGSSYGAWIDTFPGHVKELILIGATAEKIAAEAKEHGFTAVRFADSLKEAVTLAFACAKEGDAVLLSPACASWDMFPNYEVRGNLFKEYVRNL